MRSPRDGALKELLAQLEERGTLVAPSAAQALLATTPEQWEEVSRIIGTSQNLPFILTEDDVREILARRKGAGATTPPTPPEPAPAQASPAPPAAPAAPARRVPAPFTPDRRGVSSEAQLLEPPARVAQRVAELAPPPATAAGAAAVVETVVARPLPTPEPPAAQAEASPAPAAPEPFFLTGTARDGKTLICVDERPKGFGPYPHQYEVLMDVTGNSTCEGAIQDFTKYFNDRVQRIKKLLRQHRDMAAHVPIRNVRQGGQAEVKLVGIVTEIRTTKNGHRLIELEDETGTANILAPANSPHLISAADTVIEDEVIGVVCKPAARGELLILDRIVRPDVPMTREARRSQRGSAVCFLSDIHIGSKTFLHEDWERFIRWINGDYGTPAMRQLARKVKYIVVNGDIVDGVGMFPGQEDELAIADGKGQYEYAANEFNRIRDDIQVFLLPGNHDLTRPAEPQPALPEKYQKLFDPNIVQIGNPCKVSIEGVEILNYHGRSMDDWITRVQGLSYERPIDAMREMIQRRHVCPVYGLRTPIAPEHRDYLVIDTVPDIFVTGHVHSAGVDTYRGVTLVNASCWQAQTSYQKMHGFMPVPGRAPVIELDTGRATLVDFHKGASGVQAGLQGRGVAEEQKLLKGMTPSVDF